MKIKYILFSCFFFIAGCAFPNLDDSLTKWEDLSFWKDHIGSVCVIVITIVFIYMKSLYDVLVKIENHLDDIKFVDRKINENMYKSLDNIEELLQNIDFNTKE